MSFLNNKKTELSNIALAKRGNSEAFLSLISQNELNIYRVARGMLREEQDIEDAIQNTIIKVYANIGTLKKNEFFRTWLIRILINECNMILRNNKKTVSMEEDVSVYNQEDNYNNVDLTAAVNSLNEELKSVTVLFYFEDMPQREIAELLDIPEGTVKSRLVRARKILYEMLKED